MPTISFSVRCPAALSEAEGFRRTLNTVYSAVPGARRGRCTLLVHSARGTHVAEYVDGVALPLSKARRLWLKLTCTLHTFLFHLRSMGAC